MTYNSSNPKTEISRGYGFHCMRNASFQKKSNWRNNNLNNFISLLKITSITTDEFTLYLVIDKSCNTLS